MLISEVLISPDDLVIGARLTEQESATSGRIADGVIRQRSFHIVLETKLHANFNVEQLQGHLAAFDSSQEGLQVLLLLGTGKPANLSAARQAVAAYNTQHKKSVHLAWITFADVVKTCRDVLPEHDFMMLEMLDDYENFCMEKGLIRNNDADFMVVNCAKSLPDNLKFRLYYHRTRPNPQPKYIGFYADKAVRAIGVLEKLAFVDRKENAVRILDGDALTSEEQARIEKSMDSASKRDWNINTDHWFFLAGHVEETIFRKDTKYPMWGPWRYFDLRKVLGLDAKTNLPDLSSLAHELRNRKW
jgi:hypothetical protein